MRTYVSWWHIISGRGLGKHFAVDAIESCILRDDYCGGPTPVIVSILESRVRPWAESSHKCAFADLLQKEGRSTRPVLPYALVTRVMRSLMVKLHGYIVCSDPGRTLPYRAVSEPAWRIHHRDS